MISSRRTFIKTGAAALAGSTFLTRQLFAASKANQVMGLQLYSVRDDMKNDPLGTLRALAAIGYKNVEHASYVDRKFYGYAAKDFKKILDDMGLNMVSGHVRFVLSDWDTAKNDFGDSWKYTVEDAATLAQKMVVNPWMNDDVRQDEAKLKQYLNMFNKSGELCQKSGMKFGYHNHNFEFDTKVGDKLLYDVIMTETDPKLVLQQLDIGNCYSGGGRAMDILKKYPGRFESMHVKDEIKSEKSPEGTESTLLGAGFIGTKEVVDYAKKNGGTVYFIIEQESYQDKTPIEASKIDYETMKTWGF